MNYILDCACPKCGTNSFCMQSQEWTEELPTKTASVFEKSNGFWTTKKQRNANPNLIIAKTQPLVHVTDDTWITCNGCNYELSEIEILTIFKPAKEAAFKNWRAAGSPIKEEIGLGIVNPRGVAKGSKSTLIK